MNIYYIIGILTLIFAGLFKIFKQKYITGSVLILTAILTYGIVGKITGKKDVISVVCSPDYKPFCYLKNGNVSGIDIAILEDVGKKFNKKIEIKIMNFGFLFGEVKENRSHIAAGGLSINEERKAYLNFSIPYLSSDGACGILIKKDIILNENFDGVIGIQMGTSAFKEIIESKFPKAKIIEIEDFMILLENFKNNIDNVHVIVSDTIVLIDFLEAQKNSADNYKLYKTNIPNSIGTGFLVSKNFDINKFNQILHDVIENNKELKILKEKISKVEDLE